MGECLISIFPFTNWIQEYTGSELSQIFEMGLFKKIVNVFPAGIYSLKVNNEITRTMCEIYSKLTIKTPERRHRRGSGIFSVNFEQISHIVLPFLLLTLNK